MHLPSAVSCRALLQTSPVNLTALWCSRENFVTLFLLLFALATYVVGEDCYFPSKRSIQDKTSTGPIDECTLNPVNGEWWCPTTPDYGRDKRWRRCPETFSTYAGNHPGNDCRLPFIYNKVLQHECLLHEGNDEPYWWCATTKNYDRERKWTKCRPQSTAMPCHFPNNGRGVQEQCQRVKHQWICNTRYGKPRLCPETDKTFGGNDPGADCAVPFYYRKEEHFECVNSPRNNEGPYKWCATTENYDDDGKWTRCKDGDLHKGLRFVIRIIIIVGGSLGGVIVVGCVLYYACDPISLLQMTLRKRKPRSTNEVQLQTEDDFQCERARLTPTAPPPPSYEEAVSQRVRTFSESTVGLPTEAPV